MVAGRSLADIEGLLAATVAQYYFRVRACRGALAATTGTPAVAGLNADVSLQEVDGCILAEIEDLLATRL